MDRISLMDLETTFDIQPRGRRLTHHDIGVKDGGASTLYSPAQVALMAVTVLLLIIDRLHSNVPGRQYLNWYTCSMQECIAERG